MPLVDFPPDMFHLRPGETAMYGHDPMIARYADHLKEFMGQKEWHKRRKEVALFFYKSLVGELEDTSGRGRFYNKRDLLAWYVFLAEAINEHPQNYEVVYGSRVMPIFSRLGSDLDRLIKVEGYEDRLTRLIGPERSQPNGVLFEFLVANAYVADGYDVAFHPENKGGARSYDLDVIKGGRQLAVECKRMEGGEYHETERQRMRDLWKPACMIGVAAGTSSYLDVNFKVELIDVPDDYLEKIANGYFASKTDNLLFHDEYAQGVIRALDIGPIQQALKSASWLHPGPQYSETLFGSYRRYDNHLVAQKVRHAENPHFINEIDQAVAARWTSLSDAAIDKKARDVVSKVVDAHKQLPTDKAGVIHVGFETLGGDEIEKRRHEKIKNSIRNFDIRNKPLEAVLCNAFSPEASPTETWALDETCIYHAVDGNKIPLSGLNLIVPNEFPFSEGAHWETTAK